MEHYEQLKNESLEGNKDSLQELKNDASAGDGSAQYWLAQYYLSKYNSTENRDYVYWLKKAKENGHDKATEEYTQNIQGDNERPFAPQEEPESFFSIIASKFSFTGEIGRVEYAITLVLYVCLSILVANTGVPAITFVGNLLLAWFFYSQGVRRLNDFGASGWWVLFPPTWIYILFMKGLSEDKREES